MSRKIVVVGKITECSDHFHLEYECPSCGAINVGPTNRSRFTTRCGVTGKKYRVVDFQPTIIRLNSETLPQL
jgi:hypothetical protein